MAEAPALQVVRRQELGSGFDGVLPVPAFVEAVGCQKSAWPVSCSDDHRQP
jgi:hypothetical protein